MKLAIKIAQRFLLSNKSQSFLIICAIAIGISVQLFIGLLIQGLQSDLIQSTIGDAAHISLSQEETFIQDNEVIDYLKQSDGVIKVSPMLVENAFMSVSEKEYSVLVNGINFNQNISSLEKKLIEGKLPEKESEILVGLFYDDAQIGDEITLILYGNKSQSFTVVGKFDFGNSTVNEKTVYTTLRGLQDFSDKPDEISVIEMQVNEVFRSNDIASTLVVNGYNVTTWQQANASLLSALNSQSLSSWIIQIFIIISVTLAISSVLIISVVQKSKQIGILKAMGLNNSNISKVFVTQGFILGAVGSVLGVLLGVGLIFCFTTFAVDEAGNAVINISYSWQFIAGSFSIGIIVATLASLLPARKSHKLSAMEVIGNG